MIILQFKAVHLRFLAYFLSKLQIDSFKHMFDEIVAKTPTAALDEDFVNVEVEGGWIVDVWGVMAEKEDVLASKYNAELKVELETQLTAAITAQQGGVVSVDENGVETYTPERELANSLGKIKVISDSRREAVITEGKKIIAKYRKE